MRRIFLIGLFVTSGITAWSAPTVIRLCEDPWPPYVIGKIGHAPEGGILTILLQKIFQRMENVHLEMRIQPWKRCLREVKSGRRIDGFMGGLQSKDRPYVLFSDILFSQRALAFFLKEQFPNGFDWKTVEDFRGYRIGGGAAFSFGDRFDAAIQAGTIQIYELGEATLPYQMLVRGRLDFVFNNELVARTLLYELGIADKIGQAPTPINQSVYHVGFSRNSEKAIAVLPQFNRILAEFKAEGLIEQLFAKGTLE